MPWLRTTRRERRHHRRQPACLATTDRAIAQPRRRTHRGRREGWWLWFPSCAHEDAAARAARLRYRGKPILIRNTTVTNAVRTQAVPNVQTMTLPMAILLVSLRIVRRPRAAFHS